MGNAQALEKQRLTSDQNRTPSSRDVKDFETRWKSFMNSLDVSTEHIKQIESLDESKKVELLSNYESKVPEHSAFHYVTLLKASRIEFIWKKKVDGSALRSVLSSVEISLRTNNVEWVYDFLDFEGLETLADLMLQCMHFLSEQDTTFGPRRFCGTKASNENYRARYEISCSAEVPDYIRSNSIRSIQSPGNEVLPASILHNTCSIKGLSLTPTFLEFLKDCLHLSLRCLKAILNNQRGCKKAMEHPLVISLITFCLLHPNYSTKTIALDILTALCIIEGGHVKVLQSFDRLRVVMGEGLRFELLLSAFRYHESLDEDDYNLDFAVTCVQFLNIVVHSSENINLRVYLQYELHLLGFDELLKEIRDRSGSRLKIQIEAYLDNRVDCSLLLEDAEAKEAAILEQERLEKQLRLEMTMARKSEANFKLRETELLRVIESLRKKKRELEIAAANRESALCKQINELRFTVQSTQLEVSDLKQSLHLAQTSTTKSFNSMSTSTHFENSKVNLTECNSNVDTNSPSDPPTLVTRSLSTEDNLSPCYHCNGDRDQQHNHRPSPSGSEASLDNNSNSNIKQGPSNVHTDKNPLTIHQSELSVQDNNEEQHQPPVKPQRKMTDRKKNHLFSSCNPRNLSTSKQLANQAANYLSELIKLVSSLSKEFQKSTGLSNTEDAFLNNYLITIYPIGWEFSYADHHLNSTPNHDDDNVATQPSASLETVFSDYVFRTCYLANISMKADGICTNSEDFFHMHSNQLPELWFNLYKNLSQNFLSKQSSTPVNSLEKVDLAAARHSKIVDDLHQLGLLTPFDKSTINIKTISNNENDDEIEKNITKSKLIEYLLHIELNPMITQRLLIELHYLTVNITNNSKTTNDNFIIMNSLTIELFNRIEKILQKYFDHSNAEDLFISKNQQYWPYLLNLIRVNLIKFTLINELKIINENLSIILECCTSLLVSTKLPLIMQLVWRCTNMLLNNFRSSGFQLKSLDSLIDWQLTLLPTSNTENQQSTTTMLQCESNFMLTFIKYIVNISPNLLNWTSELNQLDIVSKISISDLFRRIEYVESCLEFLIHFCKATDKINSSHDDNNSSHNDNNVNDKTTNKCDLILNSVLIDHLSKLLTKTSETVLCILHSTAYWIMAFQPTSSSSSSTGYNVMLTDDWLNPLVRFAFSFKNCVYELERKLHHSENALSVMHGLHSSSTHSHCHNQKYSKEQEKLPSSSSKRENRHRKPRTRQLDTDGLMDDILQNLTLNPLRTDIHVRRDKTD
ncbi:Formin-like protein [Schistosoma japonicum]|nr:Formin-like protein [Schistosoma japonicum]